MLDSKTVQRGDWLVEFQNQFRRTSKSMARSLQVILTTTFVFGLFGLVESRAEGPNSGQIALTSPLDYQVFQRQSREAGEILIEGSASAHLNGNADSSLQLQFRFAGRSVDHDTNTEWQPLAYDARVPRFLCSVPAPAGGWYRLEVRAVADAKPFATNLVEHVGIGEIFVVAGQSNSANHGETRQQPKSGLVVAFDGSTWAIANDPQPGASGASGSFIPSLGDALAGSLKLPIGFICTGAGGTSVREWLPKGSPVSAPPTTGQNVATTGPHAWISTGGLYRRLVERIRVLGPNGFRAVLWHQGESDNHQPTGRNITPAEYQTHLRQLIESFRRDAGWQAPWFIAQASYHIPTDPGLPELRNAQKALTLNGFANPGPNTDELGPDFREDNGRGVHFNSRGLQQHGVLWSEKIIPWLEQVVK